jgi:phospholipase/lecithinase/hemolysin
MKARLTLLSAAFSTLAVASGSTAPYSAIYAFGDSLSDAGNAFIATGGATPAAPPYASVDGYGVFSNGPVWVQDLANNLGLGPLLPSRAGGTDFAVGGAATGAFGAYPGSPGDLLPAPGNSIATSQLAMFTAALPHPAANALYTLSIGSNDIATIFALDAGNPPQAAADAAVVIGNITTFVGDLAAEGARNFVVLNVPDIGVSPLARAQGAVVAAELSAFTAGFDAGLQQSLDGLAQSDGVDLRLIDTFALVDQAVADPARFGLTDLTDPCLLPGGTMPCADPDQYLFWDNWHPTETGQIYLADTALLPEPSTAGLLASGLAAFALVAARRRARDLFRGRQNRAGIRNSAETHAAAGHRKRVASFSG